MININLISSSLAQKVFYIIYKFQIKKEWIIFQNKCLSREVD